MNNRIDHIVIGACSLEIGVAELHGKLGVRVPQGGAHPAMSTRNAIMRCGDECFLEIISIDPDAPPPGRPRWFTLDAPVTQRRLAMRPRALCWVVSTDALDAVVAASSIDLGEVVSLTRGSLAWRLTVPADGSLADGGLLPAFIEWAPGPHPSTAQRDLGVRLLEIRLTHPDPDGLRARLEVLGVSHLATVAKGPLALAFDVQAPAGRVTLD